MAQDLVIPSAVSLVVSTWLLTRGLDEEDDKQFAAEVAAQSAANAKVDLAPRGKLVFATGQSHSSHAMLAAERDLA